MSARDRNIAARTGLALAISFALLGAFMLCDCPQFFGAAAAFSLLAILCGKLPTRAAGVIVLVVSIGGAVDRLQRRSHRQTQMEAHRARANQTRPEQMPQSMTP